MNQKLTVANIITMARILLVPIILVLMLTEMENKEILAFIVFILASITDAFDGYFARKYNQITDLGKFLDPFADKLLIVGALLALVYLGYAAAWAVFIIIFREIFFIGFRFYFLVKENSFSASWIAKKKTMFQAISVGILIIHTKLPYPDLFLKIGTYVLYIAVILTVYSGIEYIIKYSKTLRKTDAL